jgi:hypothetical protein
MARIRSVKPQLRTSQVVARWPFEIRYFFVLLWGYLDDYGRGLDVPKAIAGDCFPHDDKVTPAKADTWLTVMSRPAGRKRPPLCRYEVDGIRYLHCVNWSEHQRVHRPTASQHPPCPLHELPPKSSGAAREPPPKSSRPDATRVGDGDGDGDGVPPTAGAAQRRTPTSTTLATIDAHTTAQTLIAEWIDHCAKRPPGNVIGQVAKQLKTMLDEGVDPADVRGGLAAWHSKSLHPSTLPSVTNEVMNHRTAAVMQSTTDRKVAHGLALAAKYDLATEGSPT